MEDFCTHRMLVRTLSSEDVSHLYQLPECILHLSTCAFNIELTSRTVYTARVSIAETTLVFLFAFVKVPIYGLTVRCSIRTKRKQDEMEAHWSRWITIHVFHASCLSLEYLEHCAENISKGTEALLLTGASQSQESTGSTLLYSVLSDTQYRISAIVLRVYMI